VGPGGPKYTALISIESFFMGGPPAAVDNDEAKEINPGTDFATPTWNAKYIDDGKPPICTSYFPDKWELPAAGFNPNLKPDEEGAAIQSWISEVAYMCGFKSATSFMYFSQTYTMAPFANKALYNTKPRLPMLKNASKSPNIFNTPMPYTTNRVGDKFMDYPMGDLKPTPPTQLAC